MTLDFRPALILKAYLDRHEMSGESVMVLVGVIGDAVGQIDNEFWFVAPEVISTHEDAPIRMRLATFGLPAEVELTMPANPGFAPISSEHSRRWSSTLI